MAGSNLGTLLLNIVTRSDTSGLNKTDSALRRTRRSIQNVSRDVGFLSKLGKAFVGFVSLRGISDAFMGYLNFEKQLGAIHSRFYAITNDAQLANSEFEYARRISHETAMNLMDVADSYSIFYSSASRTLGAQGAKEVYENWTKVARVLHVSGEQYKSIMYAQREMSSKGRLYAQDLMIQMGTHVPDIKNIATTAIKNLGIAGVTSIEDFQKYTKTGKGSDVMGRFLLEMSREAKRRYATDEALRNALKQPDALVNRLQIIGQDFLIGFSKAGGQVMIVKILEGIANVLTRIDYDALTKTLGNWARKTGDFFNFMTNNIGIIIGLLKVIAFGYVANRIGAGLNALRGVGGMLTLGKSVAGRQASKFALRSLLMGSSGWLGTLIATGVLGGGKKLLGGLIVKALGFFGGPWGLLITTILSFLPSIITWIGKLWAAYKGKNLTFDEYLTSQGITRDKLKTAMETLNKHDYRRGTGILGQDAQKLLGADLGSKVMYNHGELVVNFNGNFITMDEIKQNIGVAVQQASGMSKSSIRSKDGRSMMYFDKPNSNIAKRVL